MEQSIALFQLYRNQCDLSQGEDAQLMQGAECSEEDFADMEMVAGGWHATSFSNSIDEEICAMHAVMVAATSSSRKYNPYSSDDVSMADTSQKENVKSQSVVERSRSGDFANDVDVGVHEGRHRPMQSGSAMHDRAWNNRAIAMPSWKMKPVAAHQKRQMP